MGSVRGEDLLMSWGKILLIVIGVLATLGGGVVWYMFNAGEFDIYTPLYADNWGSCHGYDMGGTAEGLALVGAPLPRGDSVLDIVDSIKNAHPQMGQPAFLGALSEEDIKGLAIYVGERRMGQRFTEFRFDRDINIPTGVVTTEEHSFRVETVAENLDPLIFSIEPMPDGAFLLTEKERGMSIVSAEGIQSALIENTPQTGGSVDVMGIQYGSGWLLDVVLHPDYEENGWVYLHYTDVCPGGECDDGIMAASMNRVDRGHIVDGKWVDVETIWQAPVAFYTAMPDTGAGGRLAFDDSGHLFISVGMKSDEEGGGTDTSPQDLASPYGKIHRVNDDGSVPLDNPYATAGGGAEDEYTRQTIWTYGHRSPQGLEWNPAQSRVWNSEMGPRGGDELNELLPGRNYGWPFHSLGLEYSGNYVARHKPKSIEFDESEVQQTLVDITPSPAISSFTFYSGERFPGWEGNVLIGSLKGCSLYRMVFDGNKLMHRETVLSDLARIRDVEIGYDGLPYLLLENEAGSSIVRLVPEERELAGT